MKCKKENLKTVISFLFILLVLVAIYFLFYKNKSKDLIEVSSTNEQNSELQEESIINNKMETNKKMLENFSPIKKVNNLEKIDLVVGSGREVNPGDIVSVHYIGALVSNGEVFQSSKDFGPTPVTFPLNGVIKGWTNGIPGMKIGGTRRLIIPADQAYGQTPPLGSGIPVNADLVFDVELVDIK